jgi:hypothetical protein
MTAQHHVTTDPYLASFLVSQKAELAGCRRVGPKKVAYRFVATERLHRLLRLYWSGEPVWLVPSRLMGHLQTLKSRSVTRS